MNSTTPKVRLEAADDSTRSARRRRRRNIPAELEYQQVVAATKPAWWRGMVAILLILAGLFAFTIPVQLLGALLNTSLGLVDPSAPPAFTPITHLTNLAGVALLIPWSMLVHRWLFGVRPGSLHSVTSHFRFDVFGRAMFLLLPVYTIYLGVMSLGESRTTTWAPTAIVAAIVVTILFAPLQSAAEEYGFRGVVFRAAASWGAGPRMCLAIGIVVSAALFAMVHLAADPWLNVYYFTLGTSLAVITWRTGGIETAAVLHAANNTLAFVFLIAQDGDFFAGADRSAGSSNAIMLIPSAVAATVAAIVWFATRRNGPAVTAKTV